MEPWTNVTKVKELSTTLKTTHNIIFGKGELLSTHAQKRRSLDIRSGILGNIGWQSLTGVSGQHICPLVKVKAVQQECREQLGTQLYRKWCGQRPFWLESLPVRINHCPQNFLHNYVNVTDISIILFES